MLVAHFAVEYFIFSHSFSTKHLQKVRFPTPLVKSHQLYICVFKSPTIPSIRFRFSSSSSFTSYIHFRNTTTESSLGIIRPNHLTVPIFSITDACTLTLPIFTCSLLILSSLYTSIYISIPISVFLSATQHSEQYDITIVL